MRVLDHQLCSDGGAAVPLARSPNHGGRLIKPSHVIMHYTGGASAESSIKWLCDPRAKASAHVVIAQDATITQLLPFNLVAWHAGVSSWQEPNGRTLEHFNNFSIGIELDNPGRLVMQPTGEWWSTALGRRYARDAGVSLVHKNEQRPSGWHIYPQTQIEAAFEVVYAIMHAYGIDEILGHDDIAPGRKTDPGPAWPMEHIRARLQGRADNA